MKKIKIYSLLILATTILLSCNKSDNDDDNNMIWDISPVEMLFYVKDAQGSNLLNPKVEGNILANKITVIYDGKKFPKGGGVPKTKYYLPIFNGLTTSKYKTEDVLCFGQFDGSEDHEKSFVIEWGDGTSDKVSFIHTFEWDDNKKPKSTTVVYLNGKKVDKVFTIVK